MECIATQQRRLGETREVLREALEPVYGAEDRNPVVLLDRLSALQARCNKVQDRVQLLAKVKQELVDELFSQNAAAKCQGNEVVGALEGLAASDESVEALEAARDAQSRVNELLEGPEASWKDYYITPATQAELSANVIASRVDLDVAVRAAQSDQGDDASETDRAREPQKAQQQEEAQQQDQPSFEVSPDAFAALPDSIRGRARLGDVQRTLGILVAHREKARPGRPAGRGTRGRGGRSAPTPTPALSIKELDALGAKVVGLTGACVLQCLRSLGLVDVSKDGVQLKL